MDRVRVLRLVEYEGPRDWVEEQLKNSVQGTRIFGSRRGPLAGRITAVTLDQFPRILEEAREVIDPRDLSAAAKGTK